MSLYNVQVTFQSLDELAQFVRKLEQPIVERTIRLEPSLTPDPLNDKTNSRGELLMNHKKHFGSDDDKYIIANAHKKTYREIADVLGRTASAVQQRASVLIRSGKLERKKNGVPTLKVKGYKGTTIHLASDGVHVR